MTSFSNDRQAVGAVGELAAFRYLTDRGYEPIGRNVRSGRGEIDLIMYDPTDDVIVFVEVKTRSRRSPDFHPSLNMTPTKRRRLERAARQWIADHACEEGYRFDLVCVTNHDHCEHVPALLY
jgi:putative endonuclease